MSEDFFYPTEDRVHYRNMFRSGVLSAVGYRDRQAADRYAVGLRSQRAACIKVTPKPTRKP